MRLLDELAGAGIAIELSHRAKRRLYALPALAPLRDSVAAPRRPEFGRGRGRPPEIRPELDPAPENALAAQVAPAPPLPGQSSITGIWMPPCWNWRRG